MTTTETVDIDAEIHRWHVAQCHLEPIDRQLNNLTSPLTPKDADRLRAVRDEHAAVQAEVVERVAAATA